MDLIFPSELVSNNMMLGKLGIFMFCLKVGGLYKLHVIKLVITNILGRDLVRAELEKKYNFIKRSCPPYWERLMFS